MYNNLRKSLKQSKGAIPNIDMILKDDKEMLETIKIPKKAKKIDIVIVVKSKLSKLMFRS